MVGPMKNRKIKDSLGFTSIELAVGMMLLIVFGAAVFALAGSGSSAYSKILDRRDVNAEYRVATSYLQTKIRQNNGFGNITIATDNEEDSVVIKINEQNSEIPLETWIYISNGSLKEASMFEGVPFNEDYGFEIAEIDRLQLVDITENVLGLKLIKADEAPIEVWIGSQFGYEMEALQ